VTLKQLPERLKELASFVVEALPTFKRNKIKRVLDLGCGVGRHCIYLAKNGFDVVGVDASLSALKLAKRWGQEENLSLKLIRATMTNIPFRDCRFDAVISVSVIHHALKADIMKTVGEVYRILRRNGLFLANLTSLSDRRYGEGEKVEAGTFRTLEAFEEKRFEELHHYFTKTEASELLVCFAKAKVEPMKDRPNYWKITAWK
jgi:SAM-dependent methyltransferase